MAKIFNNSEFSKSNRHLTVQLYQNLGFYQIVFNFVAVYWSKSQSLLFKEITIMKRIRLYMTAIVLAMAGIMAMGVHAQVLRDADFNSIGRINGNGVVRDGTGRSAGSFDADGTVRDAKGNAVGAIKQLEIFDTEGKRIGYINTDGTVRDGESNVLGYISINDGKVTDAEKKTLGFARGVRVDWIACYFFFHFFDK